MPSDAGIMSALPSSEAKGAVIRVAAACDRCAFCQNRCLRLWQGVCSGSSCPGGYQRCMDRCSDRFCAFCWGVTTVIPAVPD
jgi:hypothetical protein